MQMVLRRATLEVYFFENNVKLLFIFSFMETFDVISERKEIFCVKGLFYLGCHPCPLFENLCPIYSHIE